MMHSFLSNPDQTRMLIAHSTDMFKAADEVLQVLLSTERSSTSRSLLQCSMSTADVRHTESQFIFPSSPPHSLVRTSSCPDCTPVAVHWSSPTSKSSVLGKRPRRNRTPRSGPFPQTMLFRPRPSIRVNVPYMDSIRRRTMKSRRGMMESRRGTMKIRRGTIR